MAEKQTRPLERIDQNFADLKQQITTGLQVLLEHHNVLPEIRESVQDYIGDVLQGIVEIEAGIVELVAGREAAGLFLDLKSHGHDSMAGLFSEIRADEAAAKREDAHVLPGTMRDILRNSQPVTNETQDKGIER